MSSARSVGGSSENLDCMSNSNDDQCDNPADSHIAIPRGNSSELLHNQAPAGMKREDSTSSLGNPALGLPCGSGAFMSGLQFESLVPEPIPFGSLDSAKEFWSRLLPVACASQLDGKDIEAMDFVAP